MENHPDRMSKIKLFKGQYKRKEMNFSSHKEDCKIFEKNNKTIALNILYVPHNNQEIRPGYISKHNLKR